MIWLFVFLVLIVSLPHIHTVGSLSENDDGTENSKEININGASMTSPEVCSPGRDHYTFLGIVQCKGLWVTIQASILRRNGIIIRLAMVVTKTTLATSSASFSYLVASIAALAAAGIAESKITTALKTPVS